MRIGEGDARLAIVIEGDSCAVEDLHIAVVGFIKRWRDDRAAIKRAEPCKGCPDAR